MRIRQRRFPQMAFSISYLLVSCVFLMFDGVRAEFRTDRPIWSCIAITNSKHERFWHHWLARYFLSMDASALFI